MTRVITGLLLGLFLLPTTGQSQEHRDGIAPGGRPNIDFFNPENDSVTVALIKNIEQNHLYKGEQYIREGRLDNATTEFKYVLDRIANHPSGLMRLGSLLRVTGRPTVAAAYYEKALKLYPQHALTHAQYGAFLVDAGETQSGIVKIQNAIQMDPKLGQAYAWLAKAYYKDGKADLARQAVEQARVLGYKGKIEEPKGQ